MNDILESGHDPDHTLWLATPGGHRAASGPVPPSVWRGSGPNPLVRAANPLLELVVPLRAMARMPDIQALRERLIQAIGMFEAQARNSQIQAQTIAAARYALCTLVDETISSTPWGAGVWNSRSLLVSFHNEAWGGEKFFLILQRLSRDPVPHLDVLELMYLCLALGLEGRYRVLERGGDQLNALRERLLQLIRKHRAPVETDLSVRWQGSDVPQRPMSRLVPVWLIGGVAAALLLVMQLTCNWLLNRASDPVFAQMARIHLTSPLKVAQEAGPPPIRVSGLLGPQIAQGLVSVRDSADRSVITLHGDGVFASGSAEVSSAFEPLLASIGDALQTVQGQVVVVGHTDNLRPSPSSRLSSNFDLSTARAKTVARMLAEHAGPPERYRSEGRGETEPLVPNDSPANRARNRRVDITVLVPAQSQ